MINIDSTTQKKIHSIYSILQNRQLDPDDDPIKQIHNTLDFISVFADLKPAFYYGDDDVHPKAMELFISISKENELQIKLSSCLRNYDFLHNIHSIPDAIKKNYMDYRREIDGNSTALWIYKNKFLTTKINQAIKGELDYGSILGYPECCILENKKTLTKMHELLLHHYISTYKTKDPDKLIDLIDDPDIPQPDMNSINKPFHKMRLNQFPFISHTPCSACLSNSNSPSAIINQQRKELADILDPGINSFFTEFIQYYNKANP